jgi:5'-3' exonuclease
MRKIIVLDIGYISHRAIFAYRHMQEVPVTYTFMRMCVGYLKKIGLGKDDIVIAAQDYGSWRKEIDTIYKAQRKDFRETKESAEWWKEIYGEFNQFIDKLNLALPWQFCKINKVEADDWASVACRYYTDREIILVSADKDWEMLMNFPNVQIFSPITKKYKVVKNPMKVLMEKIHGDISDNLLTAPSSEMEFDRRKKIVDLINPLPDFIEQPIIEKFKSFLPKNLYVHKLPYRSIAADIDKLYKGEKNA